MTGVGGNAASLGSPPPIRPAATSSTGISAVNVHSPDATAAQPTIRRPLTQQPSGMRAARIGYTQGSNIPAMVNTPHPTSARKRSFEAAFVQPTTPVTSPLEQRLQSRPGQPTTTLTLTPSSSSHGISPETLQRLYAFLDQSRITGDLNDLVWFRACVLKDACVYHDTFYLCLHQLLCRAAADPLFSMQVGFGDEQLRGFDTLQDILFSNGDLPPAVLTFFATFPYLDPTGASPMPGHIVAEVRAFLCGLERDWPGLRQACITRGYPPFTDELRKQLRMGSPVLQRVLFNSIHRQLPGTDNPVWVEQGLRLFDENQREVQERLAVNGYPPLDQQVDADARQLGALYVSYRSTILQRAGLETTPILASSPTEVDKELTQNPTIMADSTAASPYQPTMPRHSETQTRAPDAPPYIQEPFNQSLPYLDFRQQHQMLLENPRADQQQQHHSGVPTNVGNYAQQVQPRRGGRPPLLYDRQSSRATASPATPFSATGATNPGRSLPSDGGRRVTATAPPAVSNSSGMSSTPDTPYPLLLPRVGQEPIQGNNQNYRIVALHHAYLRSPKYQISDGQGVMKPIRRLYQVPTGCVLWPQVLGQSCPYFSWQFEIPVDHLQRKAKDLLFVPDPRNPSLAEPIRQVTGGSLLYRLKCVEVPASTTPNSMPEDVWVTRETVWPVGIFLAINDKQLEVRRKLHHGKDLTIDLTKDVKDGLNTLTCSLLRTTEETKLGKNFAIAVEVVEIISDERIRDLPFFLKEADARDAITKSLNSGLHSKSSGTDTNKDKNADEDEEIQVVDAHISIDITDPYTARVFELPARGKTCLHRECFDLQTFLDTRKARTSEKDRERAPTSPDEWKCPICKKDARPQNLVVDGYLQRVRRELGEKGLLDVKAIRVVADGTWEPVLDIRKVKRDSSNTDDAGGEASRRQSSTGPSPGVVVERWMGQNQGRAEAAMGQSQGRSETVVIELD
jgi:hypothetical protein